MAKTKAARVKKSGSNPDAFETDLLARHGDKDSYTAGRYTRVFEVNENGVPMVERDHDANKARLVEEARNTGVRVTSIDDVTLDEDEYLDNGNRYLVYSGPVAEVVPTEHRASDEDAEGATLDPTFVVEHDANPKPGQGQKGGKIDPAALAEQRG